MRDSPGEEKKGKPGEEEEMQYETGRSKRTRSKSDEEEDGKLKYRKPIKDKPGKNKNSHSRKK